MENIFEINTETFNNDGKFTTFKIDYPTICQENSYQTFVEVQDTMNTSTNDTFPIDGLDANFTSFEVLSNGSKILKLKLLDFGSCKTHNTLTIAFEGKLKTLNSANVLTIHYCVIFVTPTDLSMRYSILSHFI